MVCSGCRLLMMLVMCILWVLGISVSWLLIRLVEVGVRLVLVCWVVLINGVVGVVGCGGGVVLYVLSISVVDVSRIRWELCMGKFFGVKLVVVLFMGYERGDMCCIYCCDVWFMCYGGGWC